MDHFAQSYSPATPSTSAFAMTPRRDLDAATHLPANGTINHERNGAMPMPVGNIQRPFHNAASENYGMLPGGLPARSPPKPNKNTQHVPCKFFLQQQCQAGSACPFSHDVESSVRPAPCKYFAKGGCKFGRKCALLHITSDGTVVNGKLPQYQIPQYLAGPPPPQHLPGNYVQAPPPPGLLAQGLEQRPNGDVPPDYDAYQYGPPKNGYDMPNIDMTYTSASPPYGSPPQTDHIASSPQHNALSVLDAPLPNSFDSNGISWAARHGHMASSVPSKFGVESPPSSLPRRPHPNGIAVRDLRTSAFGDRGMDNRIASMGSSPPSGPDEPITFEKRSLLSSHLHTRPMVSASLGARIPNKAFEYSDEDDDDADREEDLLPSSLHDLIPEGRIRKDSRSRPIDASPASFLAAQRRTLSGHGTPSDTKIGSPSRFTGMFARNPSSNGFGHVGSPLRDHGFATSTTSRLTSNGDLSPGVSSPPRQASMSMLTQGLQRTNLNVARAQAAAGAQAPPIPSRTLSNGSSGPGRSSLDRGISGNNVSSRIDEDQQELFDMDGLGAPAEIPTARPLTMNGSLPREEPRFGPIGGQRMAK